MFDMSVRASIRKITHRRRVQRRSAQNHDWLDLEGREISHHSVKRMRRYRLRRFVWVLQVTFFLLIGLCVPYLAKWGYQKVFFEGEHLRLSELIINTGGTFSQSEIAEIASRSVMWPPGFAIASQKTARVSSSMAAFTAA